MSRQVRGYNSRYISEDTTLRSQAEASSTTPEDMDISASEYRDHQIGGRCLDARFYNDKTLADVTVIFGPNGEHRFEGHRLVPCNSIEWFNRSSANFKEARSSEITLQGDDTEAVRAMIKWAYTNQYFESVEHPSSLEEAQQLFLQHLRVFIVADKYVAEGLEPLVLNRLERLAQYYLSKPIEGRPETSASSFMRFAIEEAFVHQTCLDLVDLTPNSSSSDTAHSNDDVMTDEVMCSAESDEDFFEMDDENDIPRHPLLRSQAFIVKQCAYVWRDIYKSPEVTKEHLRALAAKIEGFGADMAREMLKHVPNNNENASVSRIRFSARAPRPRRF